MRRPPHDFASWARRFHFRSSFTEADNAAASSELSVDGGSSANIFLDKSTIGNCGRLNMCVVPWYAPGRNVRPGFGRRLIMISSSSFVAPSAIAVLSTALLCSQSGTAMSQTEAGPAAPLPSITVVAPKQVARPRQVARPQQRPARAATVASPPAAPTPKTPAPGSVLARIAELEKRASSCNEIGRAHV